MAQISLTFYFGNPSSYGCPRDHSGEKRPAPTTARNPGASKHRKKGTDLSWTVDFPWLETSEDDSGESMMWCSLCRRPKQTPLGRAAWLKYHVKLLQGKVLASISRVTPTRKQCV